MRQPKPKRFSPASGAALVVLIAACGHSAPTRLYTLAAETGKGAAPYEGPPVQIESVVMPPGLDGSRIVRRASKNEVEARDTEHWSAPLGQLMRQTLTENLASRLPAGSVIFPDAPRPDPTAGMVIDILSCDDTGSGLSLEASWSIMKTDRSGLAFRGATRITRASADNAGAMADAMSGALSDLADAIVRDLIARPQSAN